MDNLTKDELNDIAHALNSQISTLTHYAEKNGTTYAHALKLAILRDKIYAEIAQRDQLNEEQARAKFCALYAEVCAQARRQGLGDSSISRFIHWYAFIKRGIEQGTLPESAKDWRTPRS